MVLYIITNLFPANNEHICLILCESSIIIIVSLFFSKLYHGLQFIQAYLHINDF